MTWGMQRFLLSLCVFAIALPCFAQDQDDRFTVPDPDSEIAGVGPTRFDRGWFQGLWQRKRSAWAKQAEADQGAIVFLGDSITQAWGDDFLGQFEGLKVANRGISGDTTRGMLVRLQEDVLALKPRAIVMLLGTNDIEDKGTPEDSVTNLTAIFAAIKAHDPSLPVIFCRIFPSSAKKKRSPEAIAAHNQAFDALVKGNPQITVVDTWTLFANDDKDAIPTYFHDMLHINRSGYERWAAALHPIFATLGFVETEADDFTVEDGFVPLFNGKDLSGWKFKKTPARKAPKKPNPNSPTFAVVDADISFDGKTVSSDGRYKAINSRLVVTTPTEGRRIQQMWTEKEFATDFELRLEFRADANADSGIFLRGKQLQCRDYPLAGPYKDLKNYKPFDWNEIVVKVTGTTAHCTCNGEVLEAAYEIPANGPIGLEGDRGQMEYRRIRIKE